MQKVGFNSALNEMLNTDWTEVEVIGLLVDSTASLGFGLCGSKSTGIVIRRIYPGGAAEMDGRLRTGDRILCVQEFNVRGFGPDQVANILRHTITTALQTAAIDVANKNISSYTLSGTDLENNEGRDDGTDRGATAAAESFLNTVSIRFIVARPASGSPDKLQQMYAEQQRGSDSYRNLNAASIVPTTELDEYVESILHPSVSNLDVNEQIDMGDTYVNDTMPSLASDAYFEQQEHSSTELEYNAESFPISSSRNSRGADKGTDSNETEPFPPFLAEDEATELGVKMKDNSKTNSSTNDLDRQTEFDTYVVQLERACDHNLGLTIVGYLYCDPMQDNELLSGVFVQRLTPGGAAEMCCQIHPGDQLVRVNNDVLLGLDNFHSTGLLKRAQNPVTLTLRRHRSGYLYEELKKIANAQHNSAYKVQEKQEELNASGCINEEMCLTSSSTDTSRETNRILSQLNEKTCNIKSPIVIELTENIDTNVNRSRIIIPAKPTDGGHETQRLIHYVPGKPTACLLGTGNANLDTTNWTENREKVSNSMHYPSTVDLSSTGNVCEEVHFLTRPSINKPVRQKKCNNLFRKGDWTNSESVYAGAVTPELEELMQKVWLPLIGPDQDVIVLRIKKPRNAQSLGFSIEGIDEVKSPHGTVTDDFVTEPRHFVQTVVPNGLVGGLDIVRPGDELLQVNGRRLRGTSHRNTVRCLRSLPTHIELVLARSRPGARPALLFPDNDAILIDEPPVEVLASEVNSIDTAYCGCQLDRPDIAYQPTPPFPRSSHSRVSEWIRHSVVELSDSADPNPPTSATGRRSLNIESSCAYPSDPDNSVIIHADYSRPQRSRPASVDRVPLQKDTVDYSTCSTMGRSSRFRLHDPRYGLRRPVWSNIPLLVQLMKTPKGFGFSLSEYEELTVTDTDVKTHRKSLTLGRRKQKPATATGSSRLRRSATLPRSWNRSPNSNGSRSHKQCFLLVDSIVPGGSAAKDGRISLGDRLLFVNDRNLSKASLREAAAALRAAPNGPCLLGIAKMHFKENVSETAVDSALPADAMLSVHDPTYGGYESLYVNTTAPVSNLRPLPSCGCLFKSYLNLSKVHYVHHLDAAHGSLLLRAHSAECIVRSTMTVSSFTSDQTKTVGPTCQISNSCQHMHVASDLVQGAIQAAILQLLPVSNPASTGHPSTCCSVDSPAITSDSGVSYRSTTSGASEVVVANAANSLIEDILTVAFDQVVGETSGAKEVCEKGTITSSDVHSLPCDNQSLSRSLLGDTAVGSSFLGLDLEPSLDEELQPSDADTALSTTSTVSLSPYLCSSLNASPSGSGSSPKPMSPRSLTSYSWPKTFDANVFSRYRTIDRLGYHRSRHQRSTKRSSWSLTARSCTSGSVSSTSIDCLEMLEHTDEFASFECDSSAGANKEDHPLDFHRLPSINLLSELHSPYLVIPPVDRKAEKSLRIPLLSRPIGIKLDALAVGGQDGCRLLQVLDGGAVQRSNTLKPNDYITMLDGHVMRRITNVEAFELLRQCSNTKDEIEIAYLPADVVESHRMALMKFSKTLTPPALHNTLHQTGSDVWQSTVEDVILRRATHEDAWGMELIGKDFFQTSSGLRNIGLENPTFIHSITPGTPADRCGLLQPGDLLLKVAGTDVSNIGVAETRNLLRNHLTVGKLELELGVRYTTRPYPPASDEDEINKKVIVAAAVEPRRISARETTELNGSLEQHARPVSIFSPESSHLDAPEPLSELELRDELNVLSRPTAERATTDSGEEYPNLAAITGPVLSDESQLADARKSSQLSVTESDLPSPPGRSSRPVHNQLPASVMEAVASLPLAIGDPQFLYKRNTHPEDKIVQLRVLVDPAKVTESRRLGLRLVGCREPDCIATYISGFTPGSIAERSNDLSVGDEIVQVERYNVVGANHLVVRQCIAEVLRRLTESSAVPNGPVKQQLSMSIVVRRNPNNLQLMSSPSSSENSPAASATFELSDIHRAQPPESSLKNGKQPTSPICNGWIGSDSTSSTFMDQIAAILEEPLKNFDIFTLEIQRNEDGYGIFIVNYGPGDKPGIFVSDLAPNGAASAQGGLRPHDRILAVNGIPQNDYDATLQLMKQSARSVRLTIGRRKPAFDSAPVATSSPAPSAPESPPESQRQPIYPGKETLIEIIRQPNTALGLSVVGGKGTVLDDILVHSIRDDGLAALDGRLAVGDRLLAVNGVSLRGADHKTATDLLRSSSNPLQLLVYRDPLTKWLAPNEPKCFEVVLKRTAGQNIGLSLVGRSPYSTGTVIAGIALNSSAAESGQLQPGDVLVEINDLDVHLANVHEVMSLFKQPVDEFRVKIERPVSSNSPSCPPMYPSHRLELYVVVLRRSVDLNDLNASGRPSIGFSEPLLGSSNVQACFGLFFRQATVEEVNDAGGQLIVEDILPGSPAALSIMIKPGDRLLTVDREPVDWLRPDEVFCVLSSLTECTLEFGRLPTPPYPVDPGLSTACYPAEPSCALAAPTADITTLPNVFMGDMPQVEPLGFHEMNTLHEENRPVGTSTLDDGAHAVAQEQEPDKSDVSSVDSEAVRDALQVAERAGSGFQVREIQLPLAVPGTRLGIRLRRSSGVSGTIVVHVQPNSPAHLADLRVGDRILGLDNKLLIALGPEMHSHKLLSVIEELWSTRPATSEPLSLTVISPTIERQCNGLKVSCQNSGDSGLRTTNSGNDCELGSSCLNDQTPVSKSRVRHFPTDVESSSHPSRDVCDDRIPTLKGAVIYGNGNGKDKDRVALTE